jgi:hypothetical protein
MNGAPPTIRQESRLAPTLTVLGLLLLAVALPGHVRALPIWVGCLTAIALVTPMVGVALTRGDTRWLRVERTVILFFAGVYVVNTFAELGDLIGVITLHPSGGNAFSLLSSGAVIWGANVVSFSLLYWQIDRGGPSALASKLSVKPDWAFPQPGTPEDLPPGWRPLFLDYISDTTRPQRSVPPTSCRSRAERRC